MDTKLLLWGIFAFVFILVFTIDMYVTDHRKGEIKVKAALRWSALWIATALSYGVLIFFLFPDSDTTRVVEAPHKAVQFITAYLVEYSLSVDNLFVFIMIFGIMGIPNKNQPRILKWGIIGAVVLRILFITAGVELIQQFDFLLYVFGAVLVFTAYKMMTSKDESIHPDKNIFVKLAKKFFNVKTDQGSDHFFIKENGKLFATIGFITLVLLESTDLLFAIDSIPAVIGVVMDKTAGITADTDGFIAITSNLFAILGLRSLFFALAGILNLFRYLKYGVSFILLFIGLKMLAGLFDFHIESYISLIVICFTLLVSIIASVLVKEVEKVEEYEELKERLKEEADVFVQEDE